MCPDVPGTPPGSPTSAGLQQVHSPGRKPHGEALGKHSQPHGRTAAENKSPALLEPAGSTIHHKQPELPWLQLWAEPGTEITQGKHPVRL